MVMRLACVIKIKSTIEAINCNLTRLTELIDKPRIACVCQQTLQPRTLKLDSGNRQHRCPPDLRPQLPFLDRCNDSLRKTFSFIQFHDFVLYWQIYLNHSDIKLSSITAKRQNKLARTIRQLSKLQE